MFGKKKKSEKFPSLELFRLMGVELTDRRYNSLKSMSETWGFSDVIVVTIMVLALLDFLPTKPPDDICCNNGCQDSKNE